MPLRRLLPLLTAALVALALLVAGVLAATAMRTYLVQQVDRGLMRSPTATSQGPPPPQQAGSGSPLPSDFYVQVSDDSGTVVQQISNLPSGLQAPTLPALTRAEVIATGSQPFTADGWRVVAKTTPTGTVMVAKSLADVAATVDRLIWLEVGVGLVVLTVVAGLSTVVVRRSLRPLQTVENTAVAITGGDLSGRVPDPRTGTEAGDVGQALNSMLDRLELSFEQREQAMAAAQESEARMRQFIGDASHELRTPLTGVRGTAELYRQGAIRDDEVPGAFARIEDQAQRMGGLVDELLLLARLDAERPLDVTLVDLLDVCSHAVQAFEGVTLEVLPDSAAPVVRGDAARLRQVVDNLISNGLQHGQGLVSVAVGTQGDEAVMVVRDEGPGVAAADEERIFDRFYRGDRARSTAGNGLGLSIVAALVAAHGGSVSVNGPAFTVRLPLAP